MAFLEVDWSVEKTRLEFETHRSPRLPIIRRLQTSASEDAKAQSPKVITSMHYSGEVLARSFAVPLQNGNLINLTLEFAKDAGEIDFLRKSLIRVSLLRLEEIISNYPASICLTNLPHTTADELAELGFVQKAETFFTEIGSTSSLQRVVLKSKLREYIKSAPKIGRGFLIDAEKLNHDAVVSLNEEYGDIAWGTTKWARHSTLSKDERKMINALPSGGIALEIGAGSGRVTEALVDRFSSVVATDIVEETLVHLKRLGPTVVPVLDDILKTKLPASSHDVVMFWENGLGAIGSFELRKQAVKNMASLTRAGGLVVIAVRQLLPISVDQLMVAAQTDLVMGIYHTFSDEEMMSYAVDGLTLQNVVIGDERPAGGIQKFFTYRKALK